MNNAIDELMGDRSIKQEKNMTERSVCYFKTRGERRATKGYKDGRPSKPCEGNERRERR